MDDARTLTFSVLENVNLIVAVMGQRTSTDPEWNAYVAAITSRSPQAVPYRCLVLTRGARPTNEQTARLKRAVAGYKQGHVALLTESAAVRFLVSTIALVNPHMRSFKPHDVSSALDYLEIDPALRNLALSELTKLEADLERRPVNAARAG